MLYVSRRSLAPDPLPAGDGSDTAASQPQPQRIDGQRAPHVRVVTSHTLPTPQSSGCSEVIARHPGAHVLPAIASQYSPSMQSVSRWHSKQPMVPVPTVPSVPSGQGPQTAAPPPVEPRVRCTQVVLSRPFRDPGCDHPSRLVASAMSCILSSRETLGAIGPLLRSVSRSARPAAGRSRRARLRRGWRDRDRRRAVGRRRGRPRRRWSALPRPSRGRRGIGQ